MTWHTDMPTQYRDAIVTGDVLDLIRRIPDASIDLAIADPPYYRVADGEWDYQWSSVNEWADWCKAWAAEVCRVLKDNGSAYLFGDEKNIAYMQVRTDGLGWGLLNCIVWSKTNYTMLKADPDAMRSFRPQGEERILFYGKDVRTFNEIVVPMSAAPMANYIKTERERAGLTRRQVAAFFPSKTGGLTGCVTNWEEGYNFPTPDIYARLRQVLNTHGRRNDEYLRQEYEELRQEYEELRRPFYGGLHTDVWSGPLMPGPAKRHECHKPPWLIRRMIESSSKPGAVILDPFTGSGVVPFECVERGRHYIAFERDTNTAERAREYITGARPPLFHHDRAPIIEFAPEQLQLAV